MYNVYIHGVQERSQPVLFFVFQRTAVQIFLHNKKEIIMNYSEANTVQERYNATGFLNTTNKILIKYILQKLIDGFEDCGFRLDR